MYSGEKENESERREGILCNDSRKECTEGKDTEKDARCDEEPHGPEVENNAANNSEEVHEMQGAVHSCGELALPDPLEVINRNERDVISVRESSESNGNARGEAVREKVHETLNERAVHHAHSGIDVRYVHLGEVYSEFCKNPFSDAVMQAYCLRVYPACADNHVCLFFLHCSVQVREAADGICSICIYYGECVPLCMTDACFKGGTVSTVRVVVHDGYGRMYSFSEQCTRPIRTAIVHHDYFVAVSALV